MRLRRRTARWRVLLTLPRHAVGAEVGAWKGDYSAHLLRATRPARLYLVDPWEYVYDPDRPGNTLYGGRNPRGQERLDAIHDEIVRRFEPQIDRGQVNVWRRRSTVAATQLDEPLDWVYIDAVHSYDEVKNDLEAWYPHVRDGGIVAGDDYGLSLGPWEDGVKRAVDEFARSHGCKVKVIGDQFLLKKRA